MTYEENNYDADDSYDDNDSFGFDSENKAQEMNYDIFSLRTDPTGLLTKFELQLRNKFISTDKNGTDSIQQIPGTKPLCNNQGIQEIMFQIKGVVNNHSVQGNTPNIDVHRSRMRELSDDLTIFMWSKTQEWSMKDEDVNPIINNATNLMDIFLSRTLFNKERELYGEQFKESTTREVKAKQPRRNILKESLSGLFKR